MLSSNLVQTKINSGGVAAFSQSLPILHPEITPCSQRYTYDQYGRTAPADSIDTQSCPGLFSASNRVEVENSLRPFLSPQYFGLPLGISGGADSMFGQAGSAGRLISLTQEIPVNTGNKNIQTSAGVAADSLVRQASLQNLGTVQVNPDLSQAESMPSQYVRMRNYNNYY
jgi:hypothetical protein